MATLLYRLGRFSFRRRGLVALVWALLLAVFGAGAATLSGPTSDSFTIPGVESITAFDTLEQKMGTAADNASARVVFRAEGTVADDGTRSAIEQALAEVAEAPHVASVTDPFLENGVSADGRTAYAQVAYDIQTIDVSETDREALFDAGRSAESAGLQVEFGGDATQGVPEQSAAEVIGLLVAALVLALTFGSLVAAGLPLLTAIIGVALGVSGVTIATGFVELSSSTPTLALMLGLAVAIDYALFIVSRYRHELFLGREPEEAAGRAVGTAGSAVVFAGLTVVIALAALSVVGVPFLTAMGLAAAGTVAVAVVIALTLLPAVLGFAGLRILGTRGRARLEREEQAAQPFGARWGAALVRHRLVALLVTAGTLLVVAVPALDLELGLPDESTAAPDSTQRKAYDLVSEGFGPGFNGPLLVLVEGAGEGGAVAGTEQAQAAIAQLDDVAVVAPAQFNPAQDTAVMTVIPASGPATDATEELVSTIRDLAPQLRADTGVSLAVTGVTAVTLDVADKLNAAMLPYLLVVVGLAFLLLLLVFRSVLVPLKAVLGFLLSVVATFGAVVAIFQWGWLSGVFGVESTGPIISLLPIFLIGVLFGLAMDYEVFLVTRMREEYVHGATPDEAVVGGMRHGTRVVTAAALIMISVFAGFILASDTIIKTMGFALAFGVAVDAFLVRMTIVPAVLSLLGRSAWRLPRWLDRVLPDVDVEGEKLTRALEDSPAAKEPVAV
ncbi:MMPL family transporter [Blastococcus sp. TML/M2B]|uniref:MMPL family transporter n=1 Tax=unclassified Blastococcus TaxID=2619396 RepID=UPI00190B14CD|nr:MULTISPECIES: MMPL family transporter [unclassified Blastococcus]MBN1092913.1 MMPL family transporter [Blastococcus sp. TML/M2B]MBN1096981.1 MMPL family transporter [Blastococcus sp. TML/C7B]